jgi:hypothetical protein
VSAPEGQPRKVFNFTIHGGKIAEINLVADPGRIRELEVVILGRAE